jgi:hypothetical protein
MPLYIHPIFNFNSNSGPKFGTKRAQTYSFHNDADEERGESLQHERPTYSGDRSQASCESVAIK